MVESERGGLAEKMISHFKDELRIAPQFKWAPPETIPREMKKARLTEIESEEGQERGEGDGDCDTQP